MRYEIHKFEINAVGDTKVVVPKDTIIYKFGVQRDRIVFWARVQITEGEGIIEHDVLWFRVYGTGYPIEQMKFAQDYKDTLLMGDQQEYIAHVFQIQSYGVDGDAE